MSPSEILVISNETEKESLELAEYYMKRRNIPAKNHFKVRISANETCSFQEYNRRLRRPIRRYIASFTPSWRIRCLVLLWGIPLKIYAPKAMNRGERDIKPSSLSASVDSELALVMKSGYDHKGWIPNPFFLGRRKTAKESDKKGVMMVSRLDGPSPTVIKRIIDDSITVEKKGLKGNVFFDARWPQKSYKTPSAYQVYDRSLHLAADDIRKCGRHTVKLDTQETLFKRGQCPNAALYCGWYSLANYIDAFQWQKGAIGYHIASAECQTLRERNSRVWCKMMLEKGVAATLGPVYEPYVNAFPKPDIFFRILTDGYLTLAESYQLSVPHFSWMMVLIGDPLYQPFAKYKCQKKNNSKK